MIERLRTEVLTVAECTYVTSLWQKSVIAMSLKKTAGATGKEINHCKDSKQDLLLKIWDEFFFPDKVINQN